MNPRVEEPRAGVIIDTSAWIEFLRSPDSAAADAVARTVQSGNAMTSDVIRLELLVGAEPDALAEAMRNALDGCTDVAQLRLDDVEAAAGLFRSCQRAGETVRSPNDCLIAAIAIRAGVPVLHQDRDFEAIARHSPLRTVRA